ncbi:MAG: indolepyruvate oxidoreductase subunit beta [Candidatus Zixiibacteriota bacterium]|jgi:indolepyruvate ferredoxin oxidoreductase beta subunit
MMENKTTNILIVGVGGQGVLLASELLSETAMQAGFDVKKSEVHGMSQRGGVVTSHIKYARKVYSPIIPYGQTDILISFEQAEALRAVDWLKKEGLAVVSRTRLVPPIATGKKFHYPDDPVADLKKRFGRVIDIDADAIARELGDSRLVNTLLLGVVSKSLEFELSLWETVIRSLVKAKFVDINLKAFARGRELSGNGKK